MAALSVVTEAVFIRVQQERKGKSVPSYAKLKLALRGSRFIALHVHDLGARRDGWLKPCFIRFTAWEEDPVPIVQEAG